MKGVIASTEAGAGDTEADVTAELEAEALSGVEVRSVPFLNMPSREILPFTRGAMGCSASVPADLGR